MRDYTPEELRERKGLTDAIVRNLKAINEDGNSIDYLNELEKLSGTIAVKPERDRRERDRHGRDEDLDGRDRKEPGHHRGSERD